MPQAGDTIRLSSTYDFSGLNFSATGPNYIWDFSELQPTLQRVDTFVSVQETPLTYQLIFFLSANLAKKQFEFNQIPGFEVTDVYEFYKNQNSDFRSVGLGLTLNGIPLPNKYTDPDIIYQFPVNYQNADSSVANYGFGIPGIGYMGGWKKRVNQVDGWGSLSTPFGTFETIRLKSKVQQFDSIYIDSLGFGLPIYREFTEYKWLGEDQGLPLLKVTDDGILPAYLYIDSVRSIFTGGLNYSLLQSEVEIYPNPTAGFVNVSFPGNFQQGASIIILNTEGKVVYTQDYQTNGTSAGEITIDLLRQGLRPGTYFLVLQQGEKNAVKKFIFK